MSTSAQRCTASPTTFRSGMVDSPTPTQIPSSASTWGNSASITSTICIAARDIFLSAGAAFCKDLSSNSAASFAAPAPAASLLASLDSNSADFRLAGRPGCSISAESAATGTSSLMVVGASSSSTKSSKFIASPSPTAISSNASNMSSREGTASICSSSIRRAIATSSSAAISSCPKRSIPTRPWSVRSESIGAIVVSSPAFRPVIIEPVSSASAGANPFSAARQSTSSSSPSAVASSLSNMSAVASSLANRSSAIASTASIKSISDSGCNSLDTANSPGATFSATAISGNGN